MCKIKQVVKSIIVKSSDRNHTGIKISFVKFTVIQKNDMFNVKSRYKTIFKRQYFWMFEVITLCGR